MIRRVRIAGFKSVRGPAQVDLSQLTVVTGANSTGKSSLLQSLLLLSQTVLHAGSERQLVLNGPLTRLGEFRDALHRSAGSNSFELGIEVAPPREQTSPSRTQRLLSRTETPQMVSMECGFTDRISGGRIRSESATLPLLARLRADVFYDVGEDNLRCHTFEAKRHRWSVAKRVEHEGLDQELDDEELDGLTWKVAIDTQSKEDLIASGESPMIRGARFDHFLPNGLLCKTDLNFDAPRIMVDLISGRKTSSAESARTLPVFGTLRDDLRAIFPEDAPFPADEIDLNAGDVLGLVTNLSPTARRRIQSDLRLRRDEIAKRFANSHEPSYWLEPASLPRRLRGGFQAVQRELRNLRYLGPLRVQPSPIYPVSNTLGSQDVGPSGEWTASVLDEHRDRLISFIPPGRSTSANNTVEVEDAPLLVAVNLWMDYLGVSTKIDTVDRGSWGHELKVASESESVLQPLTHVGVGVSQCLPVVVSLLLAPIGSMTLLEQPELHLHPAVQSRLGDFLLAMTLSGRQCLVETHSEHIVNRLRLRIAESQTEGPSIDVAIYFTELGPDGTRYGEVVVNEYGVIENWPQGFFDQAQSDTEALLMAGLEKRKANRSVENGG